MNPPRFVRLILSAALVATPLLASAQIYRCESATGVPLYQNAPGPGCKTLDLPNLTTIPAPKLPAQPAGARPGGGGQGGGAPQGSATGQGGSGTGANGTAAGFPRVDPGAQRARDLDRRRILEDELKKEEARLGELRAEFNAGEPERRGDERNFQKYLDRVQRLKEDIARSESSVSSLRREMASLRD
jgi:hypothetical protein